MNKIFATLLSCLTIGCAQPREIVVSEMFQICMAGASGAQVTNEMPVDVERANYEDKTRSIRLTFSHYPGDRSQDDKRSQYQVGGPLNIKVLNQVVGPNAITSVIEFDSVAGGVMPRAYGRMAYKAKIGKSTSDDVRRMLESWNRCANP